MVLFCCLTTLIKLSSECAYFRYTALICLILQNTAVFARIVLMHAVILYVVISLIHFSLVIHNHVM